MINGREKTMLVFFPSLEVKVVWRTLLENTAQKRRTEKCEIFLRIAACSKPTNYPSSRPEPIKVSSQSPAARNAQPNYGLLSQVPVDTWFPKESREGGGGGAQS